MYIKASVPYLHLKISTQLLLTLSPDYRMRECTPATSLKDFGMAYFSMPLQRRHLKSSHKILFSTQPPTKEQTYYTPRTEFFVGKIISPGYSKDQALDTFGVVVYVLEHWRIYFSLFLFIRLIFDVVVMIVR